MKTKEYKIRESGREIRFGIVSDTHLCCLHEDLKSLNEMYDIFRKENVRYVFHSGDITDGIGVYRGQEQFLKEQTTDKQAKYTTERYPKVSGLETIFITGNHDLRHFEKGGNDVGSLITHGGSIPSEDGKLDYSGRDDLIYLGRYSGRINFNGVKIDLVHPDAGFTYAISYSPQKYINELEGGSKPDILIYGHLHRLMYMNYRNIHLFMAGAFQRQNDYLKRKGIQPAIGGWIVDVKLDRKRRLHKVKPIIYRFH